MSWCSWLLCLWAMADSSGKQPREMMGLSMPSRSYPSLQRRSAPRAARAKLQRCCPSKPRSPRVPVARVLTNGAHRERNYYQNLFRQGHENMAKVPRDGYFEVDGLRCLVMPRLGDTLSGVLKKRGAFSPPNLALCATQVVRLSPVPRSRTCVGQGLWSSHSRSTGARAAVSALEAVCVSRREAGQLHVGQR